MSSFPNYLYYCFHSSHNVINIRKGTIRFKPHFLGDDNQKRKRQKQIQQKVIAKSRQNILKISHLTPQLHTYF